MRDLLASVHYSEWVLPVLLLLPLVGAAIIGLLGRPADSGPEVDYEHGRRVRAIALGTLVLEALISLGLWWAFDATAAGWQFRVDFPWIPDWGARFTLGVDGISLFMILLTTCLMPLAILGDWTSVRTRLRSHYALFLVLTTGMIGVFIALDLLLFYVFWEIMLVPMYFIIGMWGGERRTYASVKFFIYTMLGSLLMLIAMIFLWRSTGATSFAYDSLLSNGNLSQEASFWLFGAFFLAFAIKVPLFPFHTWLPDAHVEAPTAGSVMLAGVLLKMGTYGLLRFNVGLFPAEARRNAWWIIILAIIGIVYGALVAMVQPNMKKLVAYSSVSHLGFVVLGIFSFTQIGITGGTFVMLAHGVSTGALFTLCGMIYERRHTYDIKEYGGIATPMPIYATFFLVVTLASIGLPLLNGFVGEFMVLTGAFQAKAVYGIVAATGVIWSACYMLWLYQRVFYGEIKNDVNRRLVDLNTRERTILWPFAAAALIMGVAPVLWTRAIDPAAQAILTNAAQYTSQVMGR